MRQQLPSERASLLQTNKRATNYDCDDDRASIINTKRKNIRNPCVLSVTTSVFLALVALTIAALSAKEIIKSETVIFEEPNKTPHDQPTLLSVVDPTTMDYLKVRFQYKFYKECKSSFFPDNQLLKPGQDDRLLPLILDKTDIYQVRESLVLSWHHIRHSVSETDVLVLVCRSDDEGNFKIMDMATILQARATSHRHSGNSEHHEWHIPSFPITRERLCWFTLFSGEYNHTLAISPLLNLHTEGTPTNLHISRGDDPTRMILQFTTGSSGTPVVMYGADTPNVKVDGTSITYEASDMCTGPANETDTGKFISPGMLHTVELTNLQPNTQYSYKVGLTFGQGVLWSDIFSFKSSPSVGGSLEEPFTYIVYGDQGCPSVGWGQGGVWTAAMTARETSAREVHHFGDLSYARGAAHIWDEWLTMVSSFATRMPLMVGIGNHEYDHTTGGKNNKDPSGVNSSHGFMPIWGNFGDDAGGECGVPVAKRFQMPASSPGSNGVFWYSYDSALVHTIVLSSEHDISPESLQYNWLEADLNTVNRTLTPWVVVELHRPLYFNEALWRDLAVGIGMRYEFENLLGEYKVDLVLAGHLHSYFRSCAGLFHSRCNNGGPTHIVAGTAGARLDRAPIYGNKWSVKNIQLAFGYGRITVFNETWMHFEFVKAGSDDDEQAGQVLDDVWITHSRKVL